MTEKESWEVVTMLIIFLIFAAIIILFLISSGITSKLLGNIPWIESVVIGLLTILGIKI